MSKLIDQYISKNDTNTVLAECLRDGKYHLGFLLAKIYQHPGTDKEFNKLFSQLEQAVAGSEADGTVVKVNEDIINDNPKLMEEHNIMTAPVPIKHEPIDMTRVMIYCNWTDSKTLCNQWNRMSKGDYSWNKIQLVWEEPAQYYVIINKPPEGVTPDPTKTILFQMEPYMNKNPGMWGEEWANPTKPYMFKGVHTEHYNNNEWWLSKTYNQLLADDIHKEVAVQSVMSTVLSDKYKDPGHIKRVDFVKFLETKGMPVHVFGGNKFNWVNYKGVLPPHNKDNALFPYKYTFNVENNSIKNYYTEKLVDGILSECLVFYHGCPNIREHIDERAMVWLELSNFEKDYQTIMDAFKSNLWAKRLPYIRAAKRKILNKQQFFPRIETIINNHVVQ